MSQDDPYSVVKAEVEIALTNADTFLQSWQRILRTVTSDTSEELRQAHQELTECLQTIEDDTQDLAETIQAVELNPRKFQVTPAELEKRRRFVEETSQTVRDMREKIATRTKEFKESQERKMLFERRTQGATGDGQVAIDMHREGLAAQESLKQEMGNQQQMVFEQDLHLDVVQSSVSTLREIAQEMGQELDNQNVLLEELDGDVERTQSGIDIASSKVKAVLRKTRESRANCCISLLIIVLIVLLILVIIL